MASNLCDECHQCIRCGHATTCSAVKQPKQQVWLSATGFSHYYKVNAENTAGSTTPTTIEGDN